MVFSVLGIMTCSLAPISMKPDIMAQQTYMAFTRIVVSIRILIETVKHTSPVDNLDDLVQDNECSLES